MKYLYLILFFLLPQVSFGAIAHVQSSANGNNCGTVTSCAVAYPGNTTAGSLLVGTCRYGTNGRTVTYSDTQTNTYALARLEVQANDGSGTLMVYYAMDTAGGSTDSTTCAISGAGAIMRATVSEFSGAATTDAVDQVTSTEGSSTAAASGVLTASADGYLYFAAGFAANGNTFTAGADFTLRSVVPATSQRLATESYIQPTAASHNGNFTIGNDEWAAVLVIFKAAAEAGGETVAPITPRPIINIDE